MYMVTRIALCAILLALAGLGSGQLVPSVEPAFNEAPESQAESLGVSEVLRCREGWTRRRRRGGGADGEAPIRRRRHPPTLASAQPHASLPAPPPPLHPLLQNTTFLLQQGIPQFTAWIDVNSSCTGGAGGQQTCAPQHWLAVALRNVYEVDSSGQPVAEVQPPASALVQAPEGRSFLR
jgi:hypothetical protein